MNVVIVQSDPQYAESLATALSGKTRVSVAGTLADLRSAVAKGRASAAIVDLDVVPIQDVKELSRDGVEVICTHRIADEIMWVEAVNAGAVDMCHPSEAETIAYALNLHQHSAAA